MAGPPLVETSRVVRLLPPEPDGDDGPRHPPGGGRRARPRPAVHSPRASGPVHRPRVVGGDVPVPGGTVDRVTRSEGAGPGVLLVSTDPVLVEQVRLTAAGVGVPCEVTADPARLAAPVAGLVVLGADALVRCAPGPGDLVVVRDDAPAGRPRGLVDLHALPSGRDALARAVAARVRRGPRGLAVGVLGAVGGAGASTLALALAAAAGGWLVDADPVRSGTEAATGCERAAGARWPDLRDLDGPLPPGLLAERLPRADGVPVLGWSALADHGPDHGPTPTALGSVLLAATAEAPLVAVDLPASDAATAGPTWRLLDAAVLVVPDEVPAAVAGRRLLAALQLVVGSPQVVVRERRGGGPGVRAVAEVLGVPSPVRWRPHPALGRAADDGDLVRAVRRGPTAATAVEVLAALGVPHG